MSQPLTRQQQKQRPSRLRTRRLSKLHRSRFREAAPRLMTIDELRLNGTLALPELHIDIHVYAEDSGRTLRFHQHEEASRKFAAGRRPGRGRDHHGRCHSQTSGIDVLAAARVATRLGDPLSKYLDGAALTDALVSGIHRVIGAQDFLNHINVFPVADGDTGTNLTLSLGSALPVLQQKSDKHLGTLLASIADVFA